MRAFEFTLNGIDTYLKNFVVSFFSSLKFRRNNFNDSLINYPLALVKSAGYVALFEVWDGKYSSNRVFRKCDLKTDAKSLGIINLRARERKRRVWRHMES